MGKSCWMARTFFPYKSSYHFRYLYCFQCYRPQTWQFYLVFPALFISGTHKVPGLKFNSGRSRDQVLQRDRKPMILCARSTARSRSRLTEHETQIKEHVEVCLFYSMNNKMLCLSTWPTFCLFVS